MPCAITENVSALHVWVITVHGLVMAKGGLVVARGGLVVAQDGLVVAKGGSVVAKEGLVVARGGLVAFCPLRASYLPTSLPPYLPTYHCRRHRPHPSRPRPLAFHGQGPPGGPFVILAISAEGQSIFSPKRSASLAF